MAPVRRPAAAPVVADTVDFGSLNLYSGGFLLPKGRWAMWFQAVMHQPVKQDGSMAGKARLGIMTTSVNLDRPGDDPVEQFYGLGSKADLSFAPDPNTGKSLVKVPGGPSSTLPRNTNWNLFLKSLYDSGLPEGIFTNDLTTIDGVWVTIDHVPEPEERKGYAAQAQTGEAAVAGEERKGSGLIPVCSEIIEGGKPWENGGGMPAAPVAAPVAPKAGPKPGPMAAPKAGPRPAPVAVAAVVEEAPAADDDVLMSAALMGTTAVLEKEPKGTSKLKLRTGTFKAVSAASGGEIAQQVIDTFFSSDEMLNSVLGQLGFTVAGTNVVTA